MRAAFFCLNPLAPSGDLQDYRINRIVSARGYREL